MTDHPTVPAQGVAEPEIELRIAVLSDALKSISKNTCCDNCREAANVARSALASYVGLAREANHTLPFHDETMAGLSSLTIRAASQPPAAAPTQGVAQPVAYVVFTEGGNIRIWSKTTKEIEAWAAEKGLTVTPVYAAPISSPAECSAPTPQEILKAIDWNAGMVNLGLATAILQKYRLEPK